MSGPDTPLNVELDALGDDTEQSLEALFADQTSEGGAAPKQSAPRDIGLFSKIPVHLTLEVDSVEVTLGDLLGLNPGEVLPLAKKTGEPLDVRVNGQLLAHAEVVVVDGRYGLRLTEILHDVSLPGARRSS